ncbi:hypothetical protein F2Q68_00020737 [Brassica cretica]|uniref:Uncharacterized protein n=1 Tax=Brassica cretica TaxID=69181 RepID=A0A8S9FXA7_BRACR|nr:hypothetical protein F2Q68_00020737 [Brassica cretica]
MSQSSNQTTVSNIVGGSNNNKETLKRKRSTSIDVTEHTPSSYSSKKKCSKPGVLADITNTLPSMLGTPSTSGPCISKISTEGKGKVVAEDNKLKSNTRTKKCRKTLEQQFDGCVDDYSSCEDDEDQAFQCDYEEESELYKEQVYDCSSEESDTSDNETINCNPISKDSNANQRSPDVLSKEGNQEINTQHTSSCAKIVKRTSSSAQMMKPTSSRKSRDSGNVKDQNALAKRLKSNSYKFMSQSSNQTTVSNIVGGSNNNKETLKRKRSTSIDVTEHTPSSYSSKKKCSKPGVLADITNTLPSMLGTPSTSGSCISKISTKGKGKVVAEDNKLKSNTRTKKCRKTLEQQFDGCVDDYSSCEDDEDQAFQCDYEVAKKVTMKP